MKLDTVTTSQSRNSGTIVCFKVGGMQLSAVPSEAHMHFRPPGNQQLFPNPTVKRVGYVLNIFTSKHACKLKTSSANSQEKNILGTGSQ